MTCSSLSVAEPSTEWHRAAAPVKVFIALRKQQTPGGGRAEKRAVSQLGAVTCFREGACELSFERKQEGGTRRGTDSSGREVVNSGLDLGEQACVLGTAGRPVADRSGGPDNQRRSDECG